MNLPDDWGNQHPAIPAIKKRGTIRVPFGFDEFIAILKSSCWIFQEARDAETLQMFNDSFSMCIYSAIAPGLFNRGVPEMVVPPNHLDHFGSETYGFGVPSF
jgi:hypothetical protein